MLGGGRRLKRRGRPEKYGSAIFERTRPEEEGETLKKAHARRCLTRRTSVKEMGLEDFLHLEKAKNPLYLVIVSDSEEGRTSKKTVRSKTRLLAIDQGRT